MADEAEKSAAVPRTHIVRRLVTCVAVLGAALAASVLVAGNVGHEPIPAWHFVRCVIGHLTGRPSGLSETTELIIWEVRLPQVCLGAAVGASLAGCGAMFQGLLMNPLADPYLIGVSAGAGLGASIAFLLHVDLFAGPLGAWGVALFAFIFALGAIILVWRLATVRGRVHLEAFILAGVVVGSFLWAGVTLVMSLARHDLGTIFHWLMGDLEGRHWAPVGIVLAVGIVAGAGIYMRARDLNLVSLGEESARQLGADVEKAKRSLIILGSLVTAAAVSFSGIIGFVGLVVPHAARRLFGADHRVLLPAAALTGASFLVLADAVARIMPTEQLPVGVVTSLLGAPFFFYLLRRRPG
jgi:iron complex transport system permease protein